MKHAKYFSAILIIAIVFIPDLIFCQEEWKLAKDKDEIRVYIRKTELLDYKEFKGIIFLDSPIEDFVSVIQDIEGGKTWIHSLIHARLLEFSDDTVQVYYCESSAPWPFHNRDVININQFSWNSEDKFLTVRIDCLTDYLEEEPGKVRIPYNNGFWKAEVLEAGNLKVTFQLLVDPGGNIPAWLANSFVIDTPYNTLNNLRKVISDKKYKGHRYDFIY